MENQQVGIFPLQGLLQVLNRIDEKLGAKWASLREAKVPRGFEVVGIEAVHRNDKICTRVRQSLA